MGSDSTQARELSEIQSLREIIFLLNSMLESLKQSGLDITHLQDRGVGIINSTDAAIDRQEQLIRLFQSELPEMKEHLLKSARIAGGLETTMVGAREQLKEMVTASSSEIREQILGQQEEARQLRNELQAITNQLHQNLQETTTLFLKDIVSVAERTDTIELQHNILRNLESVNALIDQTTMQSKSLLAKIKDSNNRSVDKLNSILDQRQKSYIKSIERVEQRLLQNAHKALPSLINRLTFLGVALFVTASITGSLLGYYITQKNVEHTNAIEFGQHLADIESLKQRGIKVRAFVEGGQEYLKITGVNTNNTQVKSQNGIIYLPVHRGLQQ